MQNVTRLRPMNRMSDLLTSISINSEYNLIKQIIQKYEIKNGIINKITIDSTKATVYFDDSMRNYLLFQLIKNII